MRMVIPCALAAVLLIAPAVGLLPGDNSVLDGAGAPLDQGKKAGKGGALFGGRFYFLLDDGESFVGVIYGIVGKEPDREVVLTDGRRIPLNRIEIINCVSVGADYPGDSSAIRDGTHTFIMRDGSVVYGEIVGFGGGGGIDDHAFKLADDSEIPWKKVARIYIR